MVFCPVERKLTHVPFRKAHLSSKKLLEQCTKLDKFWGHVFTANLELESPDSWYNKLVDLIEKQQTAPIWMSETKVRFNRIRRCFWVAVVIGLRKLHAFK